MSPATSDTWKMGIWLKRSILVQRTRDNDDHCNHVVAFTLPYHLHGYRKLESRLADIERVRVVPSRHDGIKMPRTKPLPILGMAKLYPSFQREGLINFRFWVFLMLCRSGSFFNFSSENSIPAGIEMRGTLQFESKVGSRRSSSIMWR